jgi:hypothetical protein
MALIRRRENHDSGMTRPAWKQLEMTCEMMRRDPLQQGGLGSASWASFTSDFDLNVLSERLPKEPEARPRRIRLFGRKSENKQA